MLYKTLRITPHQTLLSGLTATLCSVILVSSLLLPKSAAAGTDNTVAFTDVPVQLISATTKNVIMILADTSGSMEWLAGPAGYQPDQIAANCPANMALPDSQENSGSLVTLKFNSQGKPYFIYEESSTALLYSAPEYGLGAKPTSPGNSKQTAKQSGSDTTTTSASRKKTAVVQSNYAWGTTPGTDAKTGFPFRCFRSDGLYDAIMSTTNLKVLPWTGNELNFAFKPDAYSTNSTTSLKSMDKRINAIKTALLSIIDSVSSPSNYIGLARLNSSTPLGAQLLVYPDVVTNNRSKLVSAINNLPASGGTPLASAEAQMMRFMVEGHNEPLTYRGQTYNAYTILSTSAINNMGVAANSPIKNACYQPSLIMLTDGYPEGDTNIPGVLMNMTGSVVEGGDKLARSADFGAHVDSLIPSIAKDLIMKTYLLIFANQVLFDSDTVIKTGEHGLGGRYYASDVQSLTNAFKGIISSVGARSGTLALPGFAKQENSPDNKIYVATYNSAGWSGDVLCYNLDDKGNISTDPCWSATANLKVKSPDSRTMITYNNASGGVAFSNDLSVLNQAMRDELNEDGQGVLRMQLLRNFNAGSQQTNFRQTPPVADILDGAVQYIGPAISKWDERLKTSHSELASKYIDFRQSVKDLPKLVSSGSNTIFGRQYFDAQTGEEVLAYAPGSTTRINNYLSLNYSHASYNSGPNLLDDTVIDDNWKTLHVFSTGIAPDVIWTALDVTPRTFSQANASSVVTWEASKNDIPELGNVTTVPAMVLIDRTSGSGVDSFTVIPNGYNSSANKACIITIKNKQTTSWVKGTNYNVICANNDGDAALSVRAVDSNNNGMTDHLYIGTAQGRLLRVDTTGKAPSNWTIDAEVANLSRPITSKPLVVKPLVDHPDDKGPGLVVLVGTGRFFTEADRSDRSENYFVSILDNTIGFSNSVHISDLLEQKLADAGNNLLSLTNNALDYNTHKGAFIRLSGGDRVIDSPQLYGNQVIFSIIKPSQFNQNCTESANSSSKFVIADAVSLAHPSKPMFDVNRDGVVNQNDVITSSDGTGTIVPAGGQNFIGAGIFTGIRIVGNFLFEGSDSAASGISGPVITIITLAPASTAETGRRSWQELRER